MGKLKRLCAFAIRYLQLIVSWILLHALHRDLLKQNIWLIREKRDEARDNGYHFYKYLRETYPEINAYYVITPDAPDRCKVEKYGNLINADSWKHCLYFLAARFSINSQQYGAYPFHFTVRMMNYVQKLCNPKQKVVFLQHGITKDKHPINDLLFDRCNIDYFVTSVPREYEFVKETYQYPDHAIGCTGMARFDHLHTSQNVEKKILVMPTWRRWLHPNQGTNFFSSDYFAAYSALLSDETLAQQLRAHGYQLVFYMHYMMQPYVDAFATLANDVIIIANKRNYDVQELLMTSAFLITDYSSVYFDFAYMNKPLAYYQFDASRFHQVHYGEGYFSLEEDGFGPCFQDGETLKSYVVEMLEQQFPQPEKYEQRVKAFFTIRDCQNCERIYRAIKALE